MDEFVTAIKWFNAPYRAGKSFSVRTEVLMLAESQAWLISNSLRNIIEGYGSSVQWIKGNELILGVFTLTT